MQRWQVEIPIYSFLLFKALYAPKAAFARLAAKTPRRSEFSSDILFVYFHLPAQRSAAPRGDRTVVYVL